MRRAQIQTDCQSVDNDGSVKREQQITLDPIASWAAQISLDLHGNRAARGGERGDEADPRVRIVGDRVARAGGVSESRRREERHNKSRQSRQSS